MAERGKTNRTEISYQCAGADIDTRGMLEHGASTPNPNFSVGIGFTDTDPDLSIDPDIIACIVEDQNRIPYNGQLKYGLFDESYGPKSPHCHPGAVEDDYSENSRP